MRDNNLPQYFTLGKALMIRSLSLQNFKSIRDLTEIPLKPLTIIAGTNSSGKSTLLQAILLITQTLQSQFQTQTLVLNGDLVKLGTPDNLLHFDTPQSPLSINFAIGRGNNPFHVNLTFKKSANNFELDEAIFWLAPHEQNWYVILQRSSLVAGYPYSVTQSTLPDLIAGRQVQVSQLFPTKFQIRKRVAFELRRQVAILRLAMETRRYGDDLPEELDETLISVFSKYLERLQPILNAIGYEDIHVPFEQMRKITDVVNFVKEAEDDKFYEDFIQQISTQKLLDDIGGNHEGEYTRIIRGSLKNHLARTRDYFVEHVHYLGPLRDDPRSIYAIPDSIDFRHVGLKGEYTASMLNLYGYEEVLIPMPFTSISERAEQRMPLLEGVQLWLQHMGLADSLDVEELTNIGYKLKIHQSGLPNDLSLLNIGVGVSQVLPTIVMCLLVQSPCTLLIEQPELHLHPRVQSILGDFFLGLTYCGKQVIVETHSEHIINRVLLRIAEDNSENAESAVLERTGILFVEKRGTISTFRPVQPNEYGAISDDQWPEGFMDQSVKELQEKLQAAKQKRQQKKGQ